MADDNRSVEDLLGTVLHPVRPASDVDALGNPPNRREPSGAGASEPAAEDTADAVAYVYVPIQPHRSGSDRQSVTFELRSIDGEAGLAVYTDRDRLTAELGVHQPHVRIPVLRLLVHLARETFPIVVNPVLAPGTEKWTEASIRAWRSSE